MAIDPDLEPILSGLSSKIDALQEQLTVLNDIQTRLTRLESRPTTTAPAPAAPQPFVTIDYNLHPMIAGKQWILTTAKNSWNIQRHAEIESMLRFEVRSKDNRTGDPLDRERAELSGSKLILSSPSAAPLETWVSQTLITESVDTAHWSAYFQAFALASSDNRITGPVLKLEMLDGQMLEVNIAGNVNNTTRVQVPIWQGSPFEAGKRYDIVWRMVFHGERGQLDMWINGDYLIRRAGLAMGFGRNTETYLKYGIYRDTNLQFQPPNITVFTEMEMASGPNALLHRISNPISIPQTNLRGKITTNERIV